MLTTLATGPKRRLGAILFADIANYARLMGEDEMGTWAAVRARITEFNALCTEHDGQVLEIRGDGLFLLFDSAYNAVSFAMTMQQRMKDMNRDLPEKGQFNFRVGINLGEVIIDEYNVSGDSVNIASRLESLARPGNVCISATVYEQVKSRLTFGYEYLGPQRLKNIREPVEAFQVHENSESAALTQGLRPTYSQGMPPLDPFKETSVAVLPLRFQGGDLSERWYADGLTEDITTSLSRFHDLFVISRGSAFVYKDPETEPLQAARQLGVRYVVSGSLRKAGHRVRVAVELQDVARNRALWGERYDRELEGIFELQDEISALIVSSVARHIQASEIERLRQLAPSDVQAYGYVLQGQQHLFSYTQDEIRRAGSLYENALNIDPAYARALAAKSRTLNIEWRYDWADERDHALDRALDLAQEAIRIDPTDARGYGELGFVHLYRKEHDAAINAYRRAIVLNPNDADVLSDMGDALVHSKHSEEAIALIERAMRLNPYYPDQYLWHLGGAYFDLKQYDDVINTIKKMQNPTEGRRLLAASYALLGRTTEAREQAGKILAVRPDFTAEKWAAVQPDKYPEDTEHLAEGLRKAGL